MRHWQLIVFAQMTETSEDQMAAGERIMAYICVYVYMHI